MDTIDQDLIEAVLLHRRKYEDTPESAQRMVEGIDARIAWLAARGLRPHPTVIARRAEYAEKLNGTAPTPEPAVQHTQPDTTKGPVVMPMWRVRKAELSKGTRLPVDGVSAHRRANP